MHTRTLYGLCLVVSFASMCCQSLLAKALSELANQPHVWQAITLGVYLLGIGLGTFSYQHLAAGIAPLTFLIRLEWALTAVTLLGIPYVWISHMFYRSFIADYSPANALGLRLLDFVLASYQLLPLLLGLLAGLELKALTLVIRQTRAAISWPKFWGHFYAGSLLASLCFSLLAYTPLGLLGLSLGIAALSLASGGWLVQATRQRLERRGGLLVAALWACLLIVGPWLSRVHLKNTYYNHVVVHTEGQRLAFVGPLLRLLSWRELQALPDVQRHQTPYQVMDIVPERPMRASDVGGTAWRLYLNGHYQFDTAHERPYHEAMVHVPLMMQSTIPRQVLVLGGGDGLLVRELLQHAAAISRITLVELDPQLIALARSQPLRDLNENSLSHPQVTVVIADAVQWLRYQRQTYDAIYMDFPYPFDSDSLRLYSQEFLRLVALHLRGPAGFAVVDAPLQFAGAHRGAGRLRVGQAPACINETLLQSFEGAGFKGFVAYRRQEEGFLIAKLTGTGLQRAPKLRPLTVGSRTFTAASFASDTTFELPPLDTKACPGRNSLAKPASLIFRDLRF